MSRIFWAVFLFLIFLTLTLIFTSSEEWGNFLLIFSFLFNFLLRDVGQSFFAFIFKLHFFWYWRPPNSFKSENFRRFIQFYLLVFQVFLYGTVNILYHTFVGIVAIKRKLLSVGDFRENSEMNFPSFFDSFSLSPLKVFHQMLSPQLSFSFLFTLILFFILIIRFFQILTFLFFNQLFNDRFFKLFTLLFGISSDWLNQKRL